MALRVVPYRCTAAGRVTWTSKALRVLGERFVPKDSRADNNWAWDAKLSEANVDPPVKECKKQLKVLW